MAGPTCECVDKDFIGLLDTLLVEDKTFDDPIVYRGLTFRPLADFVDDYDGETGYSILAHDNDLFVIAWRFMEQEFEMTCNGKEFEHVHSVEEFDNYLDRWVFKTETKTES